MAISFLVSASRPRICSQVRGRFGLLYVGGNFPSCRFENFVLFAVTIDLQSAEEVNQIPGIVWLNDIRERRHGSTIHAGHEDLVDILIGGTAFEAGIILATRKVVWTNGLIFAVGKSRCRRAVSLALRAMAFPAFQLREQGLAVSNARW
jgi:hypothetical protein